MKTLNIFKSYRLSKIFYELYYPAVKAFSSDFLLINSFLPVKEGRVGINNFGDDLNIHLMKLISGKRIIPLQYCKTAIKNEELNYLCIGSYLHNSNNGSVIWGTGAIEERLPDRFRFKKIHAVRGPKTRDLLIKNGINCPEVYGDPALLLPLFYKPTRPKKYRLGIIPHIVDKNDSVVHELATQSGVKILDIQHSGVWTDFIEQINECEVILSSSLHGIIISDAYNIPNVWAKFGAELIGDKFKFQDYFLSVNREIIDPVKFNKSIDIEEVVKLSYSWKKITFNPHLLLEACPFRK